MAVQVKFLHPQANNYHVGEIPYWLDEANPKTAAEQLNDGYAFGGWQPFGAGVVRLNADNSFSYPGDPPQHPIAEMHLRDELILMYQHSWVAVVQPDRSFELCRMD